MQIVQKISKVIDVKFVSLGFIAILAVGAFVFWLSDNPFARTFQIGAALLCIGLCGTSTAVVIRLFRSARLLARITGVIFVAIALLLCGLCAVFLHQNRLILRSDLRATDWQADTQYLADLIPRVHPKPFAHVSVGAYRDNVGDATSKITSGSEAQTEMSLVKLVASLQDGHSTLFPFQPATGFRMLPLQIYLLGDGWYVTDASPRYAHLVGKRIVSVGSERVEEALTIVRPYVGADNEATIEDRAPLYLLCPEVLQALGVSQSADSVRFQVSDERGSIDEVEIRPVSLVGYLYWYFEPLQQWKHKPAQEQLPLYRQYLWDYYWFRYLDADQTMYVAFNQVRDKSDESFERFGGRILNLCAAKNAKRLVLDVRNNSGGDNTIFRGFIQQLRNSRMNAPGKLYLIIGRHTFSAAVNFTSAMESQTKAILVGEPAGAGPNHYGDPQKYILPRSKLLVFIASRYHQWGSPNDTRRSHEPVLYVPLTHTDYFANRDPVLAAILGQSLN